MNPKLVVTPAFLALLERLGEKTGDLEVSRPVPLRLEGYAGRFVELEDEPPWAEHHDKEMEWYMDDSIEKARVLEEMKGGLPAPKERRTIPMNQVFTQVKQRIKLVPLPDAEFQKLLTTQPQYVRKAIRRAARWTKTHTPSEEMPAHMVPLMRIFMSSIVEAERRHPK